MTDRIMHISFKPQDMQLVREFINNRIYENIVTYDENLYRVSIDLQKVISCDTLCDGVTDLIIDMIKLKNLKEHIWKTYTKIDDNEKDNVYIEACRILDKKRDFIKDTIYNKVYDFLIDNNEENLDVNLDIDMDGFFKFRMKDFISYISIISDIALEEHLIKRDKKEFLDSLKYFIDIQEEKMEFLRITITREGLFLLSDEHGKIVEEFNNQELINIAMEENLNKEDLLISAVMTLCPKKIEIIDNLKNDKSKDVIEVIKLLFEGRVIESYLN